MNLWHLTHDAQRAPFRVSAGEQVILQIGAWPIEPGQSVWVEYQMVQPGGAVESGRAPAEWQQNTGVNSYWQATLGLFAEGRK